MQLAAQVVRHQHPQQEVPAVGVAAVVVVGRVVRQAELLLPRLQVACSVRPQQMAPDEAVLLPRLRLPSLVFHSSDQRQMETFWSHGIRSPRKKRGVDRQILRPVITRGERSRLRGISCSRTPFYPMEVEVVW